MMNVEPIKKNPASEFGAEFWANILKRDLATIASLESFAHLEFIGARWILAVPATHWDAELHNHVSDEFNHFQMLHTEAHSMMLKLSKDDLFDTFQASAKCKVATEKYLNKLWYATYKEILKTASFKNEPHLLYSTVTLMIERRLMKIYPHIATAALTKPLRDCARKLIEDEKVHITLVKSHFSHFLDDENSEEAKRYFAIEEEQAKIWLSELAEITK